MPTKCEACLRELTEARPLTAAGMNGKIVNEVKFNEIEGILMRVHKDLEFRSRVGLAHSVSKVMHWFAFHGEDFPELPALAQAPVPVSTQDAYVWIRDFCDFLAKKAWADEIHLESCAAHREMMREIVRLNSR